MAEAHAQNGRNRLLAALDQETYRAIAPQLKLVRLGLKTSVYEQDKPIEYAYFPVNGVISMLALVEDDVEIEVATVGNEGMVGLPLFLGMDVTAGRAFSQVPGDAICMKAEAFKKAFQASEPFRTVLYRYTQALLVQISQGNACNRVHSIEERCARWLLQTHDRVEADEFTLTQEFLGQMLGVRRASVNVVSSMLQQAGFIRYSRGRITVTDRAGLESASCRCYEVIRKEYDRMLNHSEGRGEA